MLRYAKFALFVILILTTSSTYANGWQRYWNGNSWAYRKVAATQQVQNNTTVVNNLIGIPVPVNYAEPIAAQGTTVYGQQSVTDYLGAVDRSLLYHQAARLTDQAQQLAGQAATDFHTIVHAEGQYHAQIAQTLAQGQIVREALLAAKPQQAAISQRSFSFRVVQDENGQFKIEQEEAANSQAADFNLVSPHLQGTDEQALNSVSALITNKCVACHNATRSAGGLNFLAPITDEQQVSVLERITTDDLTKRMPKRADGSAGEKLNIGELSIMFRAMNAKE